jgi:hypothetical protein
LHRIFLKPHGKSLFVPAAEFELVFDCDGFVHCVARSTIAENFAKPNEFSNGKMSFNFLIAGWVCFDTLRLRFSFSAEPGLKARRLQELKR